LDVSASFFAFKIPACAGMTGIVGMADFLIPGTSGFV
jgi:hypothetical protein